jgi:precorrin-3B synthase
MGDAAQFHRGVLAGSVMNRFAIKGWCPSAYRPMQSGDGLVVRVRPRGGRLSSAQAWGIADLAERHGNGLIDLTGRANLQIRGVSTANHAPLLDALASHGLIDPDEDTETQRNIVVAPFWNEGDDTCSLAAELEQVLAGMSLGLPAKFGFAIDCGRERVMSLAPADIRIERGADGGLIVRADGSSLGRTVERAEAVATTLSLATWFVTCGGAKDGRGRMAAHIASGAKLPDALAGQAAPAPAISPPAPGLCGDRALVALAFGQLQSTTLKFLGRLAPALRITPWRMILIEGLSEMPRHDGLVTRADDSILRVVACTGAPACPQAYAETRALAAALAPILPADTSLHVSGCAKGCAHPGTSSITLVGTGDGFDLVRDGCTRDIPTMHGLDPATMLAHPAARLGGG